LIGRKSLRSDAATRAGWLQNTAKVHRYRWPWRKFWAARVGSGALSTNLKNCMPVNNHKETSMSKCKECVLAWQVCDFGFPNEITVDNKKQA
jgi:hypothetical protein